MNEGISHDPLTKRLSAALIQARTTRLPIEPLTDAYPDLTVQAAYAIAARGVEGDIAGGAQLVGHKIGLTAEAVQRQLGVSTPDYGALLDVMEIEDGGVISAGSYISPRIELELAFKLTSPLRGPGVTTADVRDATETVHPAIELVDSRIAGWRIKLADTVADRGSAAGFVLGAQGFTLDQLDVAKVVVQLERNGAIVETGRSDAVLGDPCAAVAWLANALADLDQTLQAGDIVLSGACTKMVDVVPGDAYRAIYAGMGELSLKVAE